VNPTAATATDRPTITMVASTATVPLQKDEQRRMSPTPSEDSASSSSADPSLPHSQPAEKIVGSVQPPPSTYEKQPQHQQNRHRPNLRRGSLSFDDGSEAGDSSSYAKEYHVRKSTLIG
jgi:hypothetical protein